MGIEDRDYYKEHKPPDSYGTGFLEWWATKGWADRERRLQNDEVLRGETEPVWCCPACNTLNYTTT